MTGIICNRVIRGGLTSDGGVLFTQFSHFIDILYWIFGPLTVESAHMENLAHSTTTEFPDSGSFRFRTAGQALGFMQFLVQPSGTETWKAPLLCLAIAERSSWVVNTWIPYFTAIYRIIYFLKFRQQTHPIYGNYSGSAANHVQVLEQW